MKGGSAPSAQQLIEQLDNTPGLREKEKTFEVAAALGKLYYTAFRYLEAIDYLAQAESKAEPLRALVVEQRRRAGNKPLPTASPATCGVADDAPLAAQLTALQAKAKSGDAPAVTACGVAALEPLFELTEMRARALVIRHDLKGALGAYDRVLDLAPARSETLYARALTRLELAPDDAKSLALVRKDLEKVTTPGRAERVKKLLAHVTEAISVGGITALSGRKDAERRAHPLEIPAGPFMNGGRPPMAANGNTQPASGQGGPPTLTKEMVDAVQNTERTPELEQGLSKLVEEGEDHLAHGRYQDALDAYKRVVPFQPENGRAKAGMAWALVGLNKPMAERVWSVAVGSDPAAVDKLGEVLQSKGDAPGAKALWGRLASSDPAYAQKANLAARIK